MTEDRIPIAAPVASTAGRNMALPPAIRAGGVTMTAETTMAMASPAEPGNRRPVAELSTMYAAQHAAARPANRTPVRLRCPCPPWVSSTTPAAARTTQPTSRRCRDPATATASGPRNSMVTATPSGIRAKDW